MSAPVSKESFPAYPHSSVEPSNEELAQADAKDHKVVKTQGSDVSWIEFESTGGLTIWTKLGITLGVALGLTVLLIVSWPYMSHSSPSEDAKTTSSQIEQKKSVERTERCPGFIEVDAIDAPYYCLSKAEYNAAVDKGEAKYGQLLKDGKVVYEKWLKKQGFAPKTSDGKQIAAKAFICTGSDWKGDYYAATQTGIKKGLVEIDVDDYVIGVDGHDPYEVSCATFQKPKPPAPKPKDVPVPKDPSVLSPNHPAGGNPDPNS